MKLNLRWIGIVAVVGLVLSAYALSEFGPLYAALPSFEKLQLAGIPVRLSAETAEALPATDVKGTPDLSLSVGELDFGQILVGGSSQEFAVTLTNTGNAPLKISEIRVPSSHFTVTQSPILPARIGAGVRVKFHVAFAATTPGMALSKIAVVTNAPANQVEIPVRAEGIGRGLPSVTQIAKLEKTSPPSKMIARRRTRSRALQVAASRKPKIEPDDFGFRISDFGLNEEAGLNPRSTIRNPQSAEERVEETTQPRITVKLTEPESSVELGPVTTVRWTASSPNDDPMRFSVFFQNGSVRLPLAVGIVETAVEVDFGKISKVDLAGHIVVQASDGKNIVEAQSPEVFIRPSSTVMSEGATFQAIPEGREQAVASAVSRMKGLKIVSPSEGEVVSGLIAVRAELQEELELDSMSLDIDGQAHDIEVKQSGLTLEIALDTKLLSPGLHKLSLELKEKTGAKSSSAVTIWVSNSALSRQQP